MEWQLLEVALRTKSVKTTVSLICVCKDLHNLLTKYDIWQLKFNQQFDSNLYQSQWSYKENYKLQKKGGMIKLTNLAEYLPTQEDYSKLESLTVDFGQPLQRYCLYYLGDQSDECSTSTSGDDAFTYLAEFVYKKSFPTRKEVAAKIHRKILSKTDSYELYLLVDITSLTFKGKATCWCIESTYLHAYYKPELLDIENYLECENE